MLGQGKLLVRATEMTMFVPAVTRPLQNLEFAAQQKNWEKLPHLHFWSLDILPPSKKGLPSSFTFLLHLSLPNIEKERGLEDSLW